MTLGKAVKSARKSKGWTQERLGTEAGLGQATVSALENDELGARVDAYTHTLVKVAAVLDDTSILLRHCEKCPIRLHLLQKYFGESQEGRRDLAAISRQLRERLDEASSTLDEMEKLLSATDLERPAEREKVQRFFEQMAEFERGIRILKFQMMIESLL